jgi:hypothetical protein
VLLTTWLRSQVRARYHSLHTHTLADALSERMDVTPTLDSHRIHMLCSASGTEAARLTEIHFRTLSHVCCISHGDCSCLCSARKRARPLRRPGQGEYTSFGVLLKHFVQSEGRCTGQASLVKFDLRTFKALPVFIFGFTCQQNIFSVTNELNNTSTSRMCIVIVVSIGISLIIYLAVASSGYTTYGPMVRTAYAQDISLRVLLQVQSDILNSYPQTVLLTACRVCVSLLVAFSYPLQTHPSRSSALALWTVLRGAEPADRLCSRFSIATCLIVALSLVVAFTVEDLGTILALVGATGSTMVSYILPGMQRPSRCCTL